MTLAFTGPRCGPPAMSAPLPPLAGYDIDSFIEHCFTDARGDPVQQATVHRELQQFLTEHRRALIELPRDHGKSFQICCRILWELGHDPSLRVKIVCATSAVAAERSRFLRDAIVTNRLLRQALPTLRAAKPWTVRAFTVRRPTQTIGPSVAAFGVGTSSTGTRADLLVCDDIVDVRAIHSRAQRDRVADYFTNNLMNLLEPDGRFWSIYTPWHSDDLNARLKKTGQYPLFRRPVGPNFEPVWPQKWPSERLQARLEEIGSASFARGYRLTPLADEEMPIRSAWVRFWTEPTEYDIILLSVDPAVSVQARADRSALVVLGRTTGPRLFTCPSRPAIEIHVLATVARRVSAVELLNLIDACDRQWNPAVILFETNAAFLGIKDLLSRHTRFGPKLKSVVQSTDKSTRVAAFSVIVENGSFRLKGHGGTVDAGQRDLFDEMTTFPFGEHDDLLDAAATGTAYLLDRREPRVW